jgi:hypothetical protein
VPPNNDSDLGAFSSCRESQSSPETASGIQQREGAAGNMKTLSATMAEIVGRYRIGEKQA